MPSSPTPKELAERAIDIVFDGPPGPESGRFVEVESPPGTSISFGEWVHRDDGYWALRIKLDARHLALAEENEYLLGLLSVFQHAWANGNPVPGGTAAEAKTIAEAYRARIRADAARLGRLRWKRRDALFPRTDGDNRVE